MVDFAEVAKSNQLALGQGMIVTVGRMDVTLFNVDGTVYAMDDACLQAAASLGKGELQSENVRCRPHGWRYDVTTGHTVNVPDFGVANYPMKGVDNTILVAVT